MKRSTLFLSLLMLLVLIPAIAVWAQTRNCSNITYAITNVTSGSLAGCTGWQGYTPTGYAWPQTTYFKVSGLQTQTGATNSPTTLGLSQEGRCWVAMGGVVVCRPLYTAPKNIPTYVGTAQNQITFESLDGAPVSSYPGGVGCGYVYGATQFYQCPTQACNSNTPPPPVPCAPKTSLAIKPTVSLLARLFPFSWVTSASTCTDSPIVIDVSGKGFFLTDAKNGVSFDIEGSGEPIQMGWTARGAENAFLALPGPDGLVHNGKQLFGNHTPQPQSDHPNGFDALRVYDTNNDGVIDARDPVFKSLRLWIDENHDGISQPGELHTLTELGVNSISLKYHYDPWSDPYGNSFRYRAKINDDTRDHWVFDVFFVEE